MSNTKTDQKSKIPDISDWELQQMIHSDMEMMRRGRRDMEEFYKAKERDRKERKKLKRRQKPQLPIAVFSGNAINFGPIGVPRKYVQSTARKEMQELIKKYERMIAERDEKIQVLETEAAIFEPKYENWKDAV